MTFKEKIVKLRKLKGLTQDDFAKAVGVSRQAVYKWESGQSYPEVAKLLEIKLLFGISIDDLLDENYEVIVPEKKKRKRVSKGEAAAPSTEGVVEASTEEPAFVAPSVAEEITVTVEAPTPISEEVTVTEELVAPVAEKVTEEAVDISKDDDDGKKKVGFFGRLFGRK